MKYIALVTLIIMIMELKSQDVPHLKSKGKKANSPTLHSDSSKGWYGRIKVSSSDIKADSQLKLGGEARAQYFFIRNESWGDAARRSDGYMLNRILFHMDLPVAKQFRLFTQIQSSTALGRSDPGAVDSNPLDLHQFFLAWKMPAGKPDLSCRIGRQEFSYGSQRLVSVREGPNSRQSFDGIRFKMGMPGYAVELFYCGYVESRHGFFDDFTRKNTRFWGIYQTFTRRDTRRIIELYYLGIHKKKTAFIDGAGQELRHSMGSRISGSHENLTYDIEAVFQFGRFAGKKITAWTASSNLSYRMDDWKFQPEFRIKSELISGDRTYGDQRLQSFNPLFPKGAYFGLAALIGPVNLVDVHPEILLSISKSITVETDYDIFWRHRDQDGIYTVNATPVFGGFRGGKHIGNQLATSFNFTPLHFLSLAFEFTWFQTGKYLKAVSSGKDIIFTGITAQAKF